jgi:hypothetical protein
MSLDFQCNDELEFKSSKDSGEEHKLAEMLDVLLTKGVCFISTGTATDTGGRPEVPRDSVSVLSMKINRMNA